MHRLGAISLPTATSKKSHFRSLLLSLVVGILVELGLFLVLVGENLLDVLDLRARSVDHRYHLVDFFLEDLAVVESENELVEGDSAALHLRDQHALIENHNRQLRLRLTVRLCKIQ